MYNFLFIPFLLIMCITRISLAKIEKEVSIWQEVDIPKDVQINDVVDNNKELEEELKTFNQYLKNILIGNFSRVESVPKVGLIYNEPKKESYNGYKENLNNEHKQESYNETKEKLNNIHKVTTTNKSIEKAKEVYREESYDVPKEALKNDLKNKLYSETTEEQFIKPKNYTFNELEEKPYSGNKKKTRNSSKHKVNKGYRVLKDNVYNEPISKQFKMPKKDPINEPEEKYFTGKKEKTKNKKISIPEKDPFNESEEKVYTGNNEKQEGSFKYIAKNRHKEHMEEPNNQHDDLLSSVFTPALWSNCPKEVTVRNIDNVEGMYIRQDRFVNGKSYYKDTSGTICISWDKKYGHWWIQGCSYIGFNVGVAYLDDQKRECPSSDGNVQFWISVWNSEIIPRGIVQEYFCQTIDNELCLFPVKWGEVTYYTCSKNGAFFYKWCATTLKKNGEYNSWNYCAPNYKCSAKPQKRGYTDRTRHSYWELMFG